MFAANAFWCQIVRCQIILVPNCFLTNQIVHFIMLVPNCPGAKLSGAKLSVFIMLVPNCPGAKLSGAKLEQNFEQQLQN